MPQLQLRAAHHGLGVEQLRDFLHVGRLRRLGMERLHYAGVEMPRAELHEHTAAHAHIGHKGLRHGVGKSRIQRHGQYHVGIHFHTTKVGKNPHIPDASPRFKFFS